MAVAKYYIDVSHPGLGKYQRIQSSDHFVLERLAEAKTHEWEQQWRRQCASADKKREREQDRLRRSRDKLDQRAYISSRKREAEEATLAAEQAVNEAETILAHTLGVDDRVDFDALKNRSAFSEEQPVPPKPVVLPVQPAALACTYASPIPPWWVRLLELFIPPIGQRRLVQEAQLTAAARNRVDVANAEALAIWRAQCGNARRAYEGYQEEHRLRIEDWFKRKQTFDARRGATNASVDALKALYQARDSDAVEQYCDLVLSASKYPEAFPQEFSTQHRAESRLLVVEYVLPLPAHMPKTKAVRYVQARDELVESELAEAAQKKLYDSVIYQIAIRTLHEIFEADVVNAIEVVAFNGVVETVDGATGQQVRPCIVSVQSSKAEFQQLNLSAVEPKACFRKLKGIGSAQLHALAPVPPIVRFEKNDARFVDGRAVLNGVEDDQNIACLGWEDFEHLIRDLFEREFASANGDVRITRASRDGGVDAVIFDPDPIRGGKLVVQAKRYTNTVGVAAVRDLYGAMTAERASKGILVTTATFGSDSYEFAKDKPITLIDGSGLLHLLQKHGVPARIDLRQAKQVMAH